MTEPKPDGKGERCSGRCAQGHELSEEPLLPLLQRQRAARSKPLTWLCSPG